MQIVGDRFPAEVEAIRIHEKGRTYEFVEYDRGPECTEVWTDGGFEDEDIGRSVFASSEEAEAVSKEAKEHD